MPSRGASRRVVASLGILFFLGALGIFALRGAGAAERRAAIEDFERQVGPLEPYRSDLDASDLDLSNLDATASPEDAMEAIRESRALYENGHRALDGGDVAAAVEAVSALEAHRRDLLTHDPRLVDLIMALASSRMGLDLAASLLTGWELEAEHLATLAREFTASTDELGVARAMVQECELFLAETHRAAADSGKLRDRLHHWLRGPAEQASAIRLYLGLFETTQQPIADIAGHLMRRAEPQTPVMGIVHEMLIPNLEGVPLDHRRQVTSRRLLRLALDARTGALRGRSPEEIVASPEVVGTVFGEPPMLRFSAQKIEIDYRRAREQQERQDRRPAGAPPAFPLALIVPAPAPSAA